MTFLAMNSMSFFILKSYAHEAWHRLFILLLCVSMIPKVIHAKTHVFWECPSKYQCICGNEGDYPGRKQTTLGQSIIPAYSKVWMFDMDVKQNNKHENGWNISLTIRTTIKWQINVFHLYYQWNSNTGGDLCVCNIKGIHYKKRESIQNNALIGYMIPEPKFFFNSPSKIIYVECWLHLIIPHF